MAVHFCVKDYEFTEQKYPATLGFVFDKESKLMGRFAVGKWKENKPLIISIETSNIPKRVVIDRKIYSLDWIPVNPVIVENEHYTMKELEQDFRVCNDGKTYKEFFKEFA